MFVALLPLLLAIVLGELAEGSLDAKGVALLGVLAACGAALRIPEPGVAGFEPVFFLLIPAGRVLGRGFGFVLGALTLFASALITGGVGPWLPFQMFGAAWMGFGAGCLPPAGAGRARAAGRLRLRGRPALRPCSTCGSGPSAPAPSSRSVARGRRCWHNLHGSSSSTWPRPWASTSPGP